MLMHSSTNLYEEDTTFITVATVSYTQAAMDLGKNKKQKVSITDLGKELGKALCVCVSGSLSVRLCRCTSTFRCIQVHVQMCVCEDGGKLFITAVHQVLLTLFLRQGISLVWNSPIS